MIASISTRKAKSAIAKNFENDRNPDRIRKQRFCDAKKASDFKLYTCPPGISTILIRNVYLRENHRATYYLQPTDAKYFSAP